MYPSRDRPNMIMTALVTLVSVAADELNIFVAHKPNETKNARPKIGLIFLFFLNIFQKPKLNMSTL